jgi:hypothetical protein
MTLAITCDTQIYAKVAKKINPATLPLEQELVAQAISVGGDSAFVDERTNEKK